MIQSLIADKLAYVKETVYVNIDAWQEILVDFCSILRIL